MLLMLQIYNMFAMQNNVKWAVTLLVLFGLFLCPTISGVAQPRIDCNGLYSPLHSVFCSGSGYTTFLFPIINKTEGMQNTQKVDRANTVRQAQAIKEQTPDILSEIQISYKPSVINYRVGYPERCYDVFMDLWNKDTFYIQEQVCVIFLNKSLDAIGYRFISTGTVDTTIVDINLILAIALKSLSKNIVIAHNHPSGNPTPSNADKLITTKLKKACEFFDIEVLDHIILAGNSYFSFTANSSFYKSNILNDGN